MSLPFGGNGMVLEELAIWIGHCVDRVRVLNKGGGVELFRMKPTVFKSCWLSAPIIVLPVNDDWSRECFLVDVYSSEPSELYPWNIETPKSALAGPDSCSPSEEAESSYASTSFGSMLFPGTKVECT